MIDPILTALSYTFYILNETSVYIRREGKMWETVESAAERGSGSYARIVRAECFKPLQRFK